MNKHADLVRGNTIEMNRDQSHDLVAQVLEHGKMLGLEVAQGADIGPHGDRQEVQRRQRALVPFAISHQFMLASY